MVPGRGHRREASTTAALVILGSRAVGGVDICCLENEPAVYSWAFAEPLWAQPVLLALVKEHCWTNSAIRGPSPGLSPLCVSAKIKDKNALPNVLL